MGVSIQSTERSSSRFLAGCIRQLEVSPRDHRTFCTVAHRLINLNERVRVWQLCEHLRAVSIWQHYIPSAMMYAARDKRQRAAASGLMDAGAWILERALDVSPKFNSQLAEEILENPNLASLSAEKATVGSGRSIEQLETTGGPLARELLELVVEALRDYLRDRMHRSTDEMIARAPVRTRLNAWATSVGPDGHERWHVHPSGWLSGVYYVDVPTGAHSSTNTAGCIQLGVFPFIQAKHAYPSVGLPLILKPKNGKLIVFPSHFGHRTWATRSSSNRICIAFDLISLE